MLLLQLIPVFILFTGLLLYIIYVFKMGKNNFETEKNDLINEIKRENIIKDDLNGSIENLVYIQQKQVLERAFNLRRFGIIISIAGLSIVIGVSFFLLSNNIEWHIYALSILPGIIITALSAFLMKKSKEITNQASEFLNKLRKSLHIVAALRITSTITEENLRNSVKHSLLTEISNLQSIRK